MRLELVASLICFMENDYTQSHKGSRSGASRPGAANHAQDTMEGLDLRAVVLGIWQRKTLVLAVVLIAMSACFLFLLTATPKYRSEARVLIEDNESAFTRATADRAALAPDELAVQSEVQVVRSRDLALKVAERLKLDKSTEFNPSAKEPSLVGGILTMIGLKNKPTEGTVRERVLNAYYDKLNVVPVPRSRVISISFSSTDPERAAAVANTVATAYVDSTREAKFENTRRAAEWLARQIEILRQRSADSEASVEEFRAKSGLFQGATTTLSKQALSELNSQITTAAGQRSTAQARGDAIRRLLKNRGSIESAPEVLNSQLIQRLGEQRAVLQRRIDERGIAYLPNHPVMKRLVAERSGLDRQIRAEAVKILRGLENQAKSAGAREKALRDNLVALKAKAALSNQDEVRLKALEREAAANRTLLESFLNRFREASARQDAASLPAGARVISTAQVYSKPTFPRRGPIATLTFVGSIVLGIVLAFLAEMFAGPRRSAESDDGRETTASDMEPEFRSARRQYIARELTGAAAEAPAPKPVVSPEVAPPMQPPSKPAPPIATPPANPSSINPPSVAVSPAAVQQSEQPMPSIGGQVVQSTEPSVSIPPVSPDPNAGTPDVETPRPEVLPFESAIEALRESVVASCGRIQSNRILVTSTGLEQDNAIVAIALARSLAGVGERVLLIDTDFHNACVGRLTEIEVGQGLAELLLGEASFKQVVVDDPSSSAQVLAAGQSLERGRAQMQSARMDKVMAALTRAYRYVILVGPSAGVSNDCKHVAGGSKLAVLLFEENGGDDKVTTEATQTLMSCGCELVTPVETLFSPSGLSIVPGNPVTRFGVAA